MVWLCGVVWCLFVGWDRGWNRGLFALSFGPMGARGVAHYTFRCGVTVKGMGLSGLLLRLLLLVYLFNPVCGISYHIIKRVGWSM